MPKRLHFFRFRLPLSAPFHWPQRQANSPRPYIGTSSVIRAADRFGRELAQFAADMVIKPVGVSIVEKHFPTRPRRHVQSPLGHTERVLPAVIPMSTRKEAEQCRRVR